MAIVRKSVNSIGAFLNIFGAAISVSASVRNHQQPSAMDLRILGIEPTAHVMQAFAQR